MEQQIYARWVDIGTRIGLALLVISFALYVTGMLEAHVPAAELVRLWDLPVHLFVAATDAPTGWGWLALLHKGDYLTFVGIAVFAGITLVCYARMIPMLIARGERLHAALAAAQLLVLALALSGVMT